VKINCSESSNLSKQDILFIHGNLASTIWWEPTLRAWQEMGPLGTGSILMADWRGCGKNPPWPVDQIFTLKDLAQDYLDLLHAREITNIGIVGHSLGGLIALQMMILDPHLIARAVLLDPVGAQGVVFDDSMYEAFRQMARNRELTKGVILSTIRNAALSAEFTERITNDAFRAVQGIGSSVLEILKSVDILTSARSVKVPTLILHGQHDLIIPLKDSQILAASMVNAKLQVLPEAGHCWNVEDPEAFVQCLRNWF
jgi:3-oxoadipate enol-lactonase